MLVTFGEAEQLASNAGIYIVVRPDRQPYVRAIVQAAEAPVPNTWNTNTNAYRTARMFLHVVLQYRRRPIGQKPGADPFAFATELAILCARRITNGDTRPVENELRVRFHTFEPRTYGKFKPTIVDELTRELATYFD